MLVPVSISRSGLILKEKGDKSLTSTTFIVYFGQGREKFLNKTEWVLTSLLKTGDFKEYDHKAPIVTALLKENCSLYWKDWSNMPILGLMEHHQPIPLLPDDILSLIPNSIFA